MQRNVHLNISASSQGTTLRQTNPAPTLTRQPDPNSSQANLLLLKPEKR